MEQTTLPTNKVIVLGNQPQIRKGLESILEIFNEIIQEKITQNPNSSANTYINTQIGYQAIIARRLLGKEGKVDTFELAREYYSNGQSVAMNVPAFNNAVSVMDNYYKVLVEMFKSESDS